ncbi:hypothetical protein M2G58_21510 [Vibrio vulnificus]|nr:hypothetical protein [Vibrio vulnificus]MCU8326570.1 hypothetical protein [Vibrio vulnificus]
MSDKVIWFCCFALLSVGIILGVNLDSNSTTLDSFYKVFGVVSGIGTLLTAIIASSALYTWRHQFSHSERFKALTELEQVSMECISSIEKYRGVYEDEHLPVNTPFYYPDHAEAKREYRKAFEDAKERYRVGVDFVQSLLTPKELTSFKFTYGYFTAQIHGISNRIVNSYEHFEGEERHQNLIKVEADILDLKLEIKESLRKLRGR